MLCVVIKGPTLNEVRAQLSQALHSADLVELRLDDFTDWDIDSIRQLQADFAIPMIFTLRSQQQGGQYKHSEDKRLATIRELLTLEPAYLDIESHVPSTTVADLAKNFLSTRLILSHHDFEGTPESLDELYNSLRTTPAHYYKIAVTAHNSNDALRLLVWAKQHPGQLIAISMGVAGQISRIVGPIIGNPITYAALTEAQASAPGQLTAQTLCERYHHHALNTQTALYGLIGDPITGSISDVTHNHFFRTQGINAVYVKMAVKAGELSDFLSLCKQLGFRGLSVTMPLKEHVIPLLDQIHPQAEEIGAVNTLAFAHGELTGYNTDCVGALNALEQQAAVKGKRLVMIGAGGAAKAIAHEAARRGAIVTIVNRDGEKAQQLAAKLDVASSALQDMCSHANAGYDILINCTPQPMPIDAEHIQGSALVMDITTKPRHTEFLTTAKQKGCQVVYGYEMFVEQALGQFNLWFADGVAEDSRTLLRAKAEAEIG